MEGLGTPEPSNRKVWESNWKTWQRSTGVSYLPASISTLTFGFDVLLDCIAEGPSQLYTTARTNAGKLFAPQQSQNSKPGRSQRRLSEANMPHIGSPKSCAKLCLRPCRYPAIKPPPWPNRLLLPCLLGIWHVCSVHPKGVKGIF